MKNIVLAIGAVAIGTSAFGQTLMGGKLGLNYTLISTMVDPEPDEAPDQGSGIGFHIGGYVQLAISEHVGVRPEVMYSIRGFQEDRISTTSYTGPFGTTITDRSESKNRTAYNYLEVPLLLSFQPNKKFGIQVGPGFGLLMSGRVKRSGSNTNTVTDGNSSIVTTSDFDETISGSDVTDGLRKLEVGAVVGMIYETASGVNFGLRYWRGLNTINEDTSFGDATVKSYTNLIQFSLGFSFIKAD
ncbi:MAG: PorT family protein [Flavobacteriales bacterium]|nr:PorT family protein [Flavobacteriales bacterium]